MLNHPYRHVDWNLYPDADIIMATAERSHFLCFGEFDSPIPEITHVATFLFEGSFHRINGPAIMYFDKDQQLVRSVYYLYGKCTEKSKYKGLVENSLYWLLRYGTKLPLPIDPLNYLVICKNLLNEAIDLDWIFHIKY